MSITISKQHNTRLTDGNWPKIRPAFNGTHVAYLSYEHAPDASEPPDLKLLELASGEEIELADHTQNIQRTYDIAADYVTWQAQPVEEPNVWDIFYHHIPTGTTDRLHRSTMGLFSSDVSGSNLLWNESDGTAYNVYLRRLDWGRLRKSPIPNMTKSCIPSAKNIWRSCSTMNGLA